MPETLDVGAYPKTTSVVSWNEKSSLSKQPSVMIGRKQMRKDRTYLRMLSDTELLALVKEITPTELELVLAERLKKMRDAEPWKE
jgi:hypothetical protein